MRKKILYIVSILIFLGLFLFNAKYINTRQLSCRKETISSEKIDKAFNDKIIVYFSDIHYGFSKIDFLEKTVKIINDFNPDIILFGGDLIDKDYAISASDQEHILELLNLLNADIGKYAVLGDEDKEYAKDLLTGGGFKILDNDHTSIYLNNDYINIIGLNSLNLDVDLASEGVNPNHYTFGLFHYPDIFNDINNKFDYCLAGHSLGGQYLAFYHPVGAIQYNKGKHQTVTTTLDITNGAGLTNKNVRLFADAEVVVYKLKVN